MAPVNAWFALLVVFAALVTRTVFLSGLTAIIVARAPILAHQIRIVMAAPVFVWPLNPCAMGSAKMSKPALITAASVITNARILRFALMEFVYALITKRSAPRQVKMNVSCSRATIITAERASTNARRGCPVRVMCASVRSTRSAAMASAWISFQMSPIVVSVAMFAVAAPLVLMVCVYVPKNISRSAVATALM